MVYYRESFTIFDCVSESGETTRVIEFYYKHWGLVI